MKDVACPNPRILLDKRLHLHRVNSICPHWHSAVEIDGQTQIQPILNLTGNPKEPTKLTLTLEGNGPMEGYLIKRRSTEMLTKEMFQSFVI